MPKKESTQAPEVVTEDQAPESQLVEMVRDSAPFTADVHPEEVANFKAGGWEVKK